MECWVKVDRGTENTLEFVTLKKNRNSTEKMSMGKLGWATC